MSDASLTTQTARSHTPAASTTAFITKDDGRRRLPFDSERLERFVLRTASGVLDDSYDTGAFIARTVSYALGKNEVPADELLGYMTRTAVENTDVDQPDWKYFAARLYLNELYKQASRNRFYTTEKKYGDFFGLLETLTQRGVYAQRLLDRYSRAELEQAGSWIEPERDELLDYTGLLTLAERYLATDKAGEVFELPQERWLVIALHLMSDEDRARRMDLVREAYWALSNLLMTVATPTLANAGKTYGQLSSCFEIVIDDSLDGIYSSVHDAANLSKGGGGLGVYAGFIRSRGSDIRGYAGTAGGTIPFLKLFDATAVAVDQLGVRKGAIAVYQDVWHKDIQAFLDLRLNNGDETNRAHNLHLGVNLPDLFLERVEADGEWYLFDPHEVFTKKGWYLQDSHDEQRGSGTFRERYQELVTDPQVSRTVVRAKQLWIAILRSQLETGYPYMFYRDTVNRANPNRHAGTIYSSNLCSEIMQNQSATIVESTHHDGESDRIIVTKTPGDMVVCNLSSITLGRTRDDDATLERLIRIQVRMLDNVIDLNSLPVAEAARTNQRYRSIGLGTSGWHHLLTLKGIHWESQEAVDFADELYEKIAYHTIKASAELAAEKGAYPLFAGSDWSTGRYFTDRGYDSPAWQELQQRVMKNGLRNGYLIAIAPTASTSIISGTTAGLDGVTDIYYVEEKRNMKVPVVVPGLNPDTYPYYKPAYQQDQSWSIRQNAARQRHVDQSQSFNLYLNSDDDAQGGGKKAVKLNKWHFEAWRAGLKTTYYIRSQTVMAENCVWCES
jgi:ribonucleoside-diphosphate reductase alpha chain